MNTKFKLFSLFAILSVIAFFAFYTSDLIAIEADKGTNPELTRISKKIQPDKIVNLIKDKKPLVQIAVLLDTSGSMDGLINQARTRIWDIINHFTLAKRNGQRPDIQVALYEFGNSALSASEGYLKMICPLTTDLDLISEELFKLNTDGGDEYCGWVIRSAQQSLAWSENSRDYKAVIIAGNEPFTQGKVNYEESCKNSVKKGIIINTIYCGNPNSLESAEWKKAAQIADGDFACIDQNKKQIAIVTPYDDQIASSNTQLNQTYQVYGSRKVRAKAAKRKMAQVKQDSLVAGASKAAFASRIAAKASSAYTNSSWDLVDAVKEGKVELGEAADEEALPEELQKMDAKERTNYVKGLAEKREKIKKEISSLSKKRADFIKKKQKNSKSDDLGKTIIKFISNQASSKGFTFDSK